MEMSVREQIVSAVRDYWFLLSILGVLVLGSGSAVAFYFTERGEITAAINANAAAQAAAMKEVQSSIDTQFDIVEDSIKREFDAVQQEIDDLQHDVAEQKSDIRDLNTKQTYQIEQLQEFKADASANRYTQQEAERDIGLLNQRVTALERSNGYNLPSIY